MSDRFTEKQLERAIIELLVNEDYSHLHDGTMVRPIEVLLKEDLRAVSVRSPSGEMIDKE